jgi:hypothetical protein
MITPVYLVWNGTTLLDAPVARAWPHVINYTAWQHYPVAEHISGAPGREGEVVLLKKDEAGFSFPPYYARTIKLDPPRRVIWKTYPLQGTQGPHFFGIVDFRLVEVDNGKTRFCYDFLYEFLMPGTDESELEAFRTSSYKNTEQMFASILPKLQKLVEQGA